MSPRLPATLSADRPTQLQNATCPYCGQALSKRRSQKEHVIGRRFVPKGTLTGCWNLHVWACGACNQRKADLEDDISAITLAGRAIDLHHNEDDPELRIEAERKAHRSVSRRTGRTVATSRERFSLKGIRGPLSSSISVDFDGPPQLTEDRTHELALFQLRAFFYFLTFDPAVRQGRWWRGKLVPVNGTTRRDFGNPVQVGFADAVSQWDYRLILTTAGGYFRAAIRKHPRADAWGFALEWNDQYRLIGYFGDESVCIEESAKLPRLHGTLVHEDGPNRVVMRTEIPLQEESDRLFILPAQ